MRRREVLEQTQDEQEIIERVAALDIGKATLTCCIRVPGEGAGDRRAQEVSEYSTMTRSLQLMVDRLLELGVTRVVMEATRTTGSRRSTCSRPTASRPGWSMPRTSSTCPGDPRPTGWTRCGCARSPSGR
jgi:hypothetical protein